MRQCWALYTRHIIDIVINSAPNRQQGAGVSPGVGESKGNPWRKQLLWEGSGRGVRQSRQGRNEEVKLSLASSRSRGGTETQNSRGKSSARPGFRPETGVRIVNFPKYPNSGSRHKAESSTGCAAFMPTTRRDHLATKGRTEVTSSPLLLQPAALLSPGNAAAAPFPITVLIPMAEGQGQGAKPWHRPAQQAGIIME